MDKQHPQTSHGVFKPVDHVVISFPSAEDQAGAVQALAGIGLDSAAITRYSPDEMIRQAEADLDNAGALASIGQEVNLVKAHRTLAEQGYHFLVVHADDDEQALRIADTVKSFNAERAQHYGHFIIEELISHPDDEPQVAESPDRGLDAQTPSGFEDERAWRHRGQ
jgi:hypothetical protein